MDYNETELTWLDAQVIEQAIDSRRFPGVLFLHGDDCRYFCAKVKAALSLAARALAAEQKQAELKQQLAEALDRIDSSKAAYLYAQQQAQEAVHGRVEAVERVQRAEAEVRRLYALERERWASAAKAFDPPFLPKEYMQAKIYARGGDYPTVLPPRPLCECLDLPDGVRRIDPACPVHGDEAQFVEQAETGGKP